jgi:rubredoxin
MALKNITDTDYKFSFICPVCKWEGFNIDTKCPLCGLSDKEVKDIENG